MRYYVSVSWTLHVYKKYGEKNQKIKLVTVAVCFPTLGEKKIKLGRPNTFGATEPESIQNS